MKAGSIVRVLPRAEWPDDIVWIDGMTTEADAAAWPADDLLVLTSTGRSSGVLLSLNQTRDARGFFYQRGAMLPFAVLAVVVPDEHRWDLARSGSEIVVFARWYASLNLVGGTP